eukprot:212-Heterococcus_DN1.PRE.1
MHAAEVARTMQQQQQEEQHSGDTADTAATAATGAGTATAVSDSARSSITSGEDAGGEASICRVLDRCVSAQRTAH